MIRGILNGKLDQSVNSLPFVYNGSNYCYDPNFFDWMEAKFGNRGHIEFWEKVNNTCFSENNHNISEN